jgi:hypothetical protein
VDRAREPSRLPGPQQAGRQERFSLVLLDEPTAKTRASSQAAHRAKSRSFGDTDDREAAD